MTARYITSLMQALALSLLPAMAFAQYEIMSPARLLDELETNINGARQYEPIIKADVARKAQFQQEAAGIRQDTSRYQAEKSDYDSELAGHNAEVDDFNKTCVGGTYTEAALKRCDSRESSLARAQTSLNNTRAALEETRLSLRQRQEDYNQRDQQRAMAAEESLALYETFSNNTNILMARLQQESVFINNDRDCFARPGPDATLQCLRIVMSN